MYSVSKRPHALANQQKLIHKRFVAQPQDPKQQYDWKRGTQSHAGCFSDLFAHQENREYRQRSGETRLFDQERQSSKNPTEGIAPIARPAFIQREQEAQKRHQDEHHVGTNRHIPIEKERLSQEHESGQSRAHVRESKLAADKKDHQPTEQITTK